MDAEALAIADAGEHRQPDRAALRLDFEAVYAEHVRFVWRVLRGMGVPDAGVDDAVQDVFIVVHRRLPEFDGRHAVRTWLFEVAYRIASEHRRKHRRHEHEPLASIEDALRDAAPSPEHSAERAQQLDAVLGALDTLDDDKRALLVLADMEDMSVSEIAKATRTPIYTVYTRLRRARIELRNALTRKRGRR